MPEFANWTERQYAEAVTIYNSRGMQLFINGIDTNAWVPFADMMNHDADPNVIFSFDDES